MVLGLPTGRVVRTLCIAGLLGWLPGLLATPYEDSPLGAAVATTTAGEGGNQVALLEVGSEALLVRIHLIRHARRSIDVQTFIWMNDECGRVLMYELIAAAKRGVKVRIIADTLFSEHDPATVAFCATAHPNLELKHYRPAMSRLKANRLQLMLAGIFSFRGVNQRMHNKVMIFDEAVLITGGRNMQNAYFDYATGLNYRDRDVLAVGLVARAATKSFEEFWNYRHSIPSRKLTDVGAVITAGKYRRYERREDYDFGGVLDELDQAADDTDLIRVRFAERLRPVKRAEFISDAPGKGHGFLSTTAHITRELRGILAATEQDVTIQTPYLVLSGPAQRLIRELRAKQPGVKIRISTNSFASTDNLPAYSGNYRLRGIYIEQLGLEIHEFKPLPAALPELFPRYGQMAALAVTTQAPRAPFLSMHAKSLVVDDHIAFIGSYNLDPRSENLNTEAGLLVEETSVAQELRAQINRDMRPENSWVIARRRLPLRLDVVNALIDGILSISPLDVWPLQNTSSFELLTGAGEVPTSDPAFYDNYRDVGSFPGADGMLTPKEIITRLYKMVGTPLTPVL